MNGIGSVVLDTSVVVDFLRQHDSGLSTRIQESTDLCLPLVALGELLYGAYKAQQRERTLADVRRFLRVCRVLEPDEVTADFYGRTKAALARQGTPIPQNDIWIAAAALQYNLPLAARDTHFLKVPELVDVDW